MDTRTFTYGTFTALEHETADQFHDRMVAKAIAEDLGIVSIDATSCQWRKVEPDLSPRMTDNG